MSDNSHSLFNMEMNYYYSNPLSNENWYNISDDWNVEFQTRSLSPEDTISPSDKIVLCVGDSFTFGDGMYYKDTWSAHLQRTVYKNYKVINIGMRGASNDFITTLLSKWCSRYGDQIEQVIIGFSFHHRKLYYNEGKANNINLHDIKSNNIPSWYVNVRDSLIKLSNYHNDEANFQKNVLLTKGLGKLYDFKIYWWDIEEHAGDAELNPDRLTANPELVSDNDFVYIHMTYFDMIEEQKRYMYYISKEDRHWSKMGHLLVADRISSYIC